MRNEELENLKAEYDNIQISEALDDVVRKSILMGKRNVQKRNARVFSGLCAGLIFSFFVSVNAVPSFAASMENIPVLNHLVKLINLRTYFAEDKEKEYKISVEVPEITGLTDAKLQADLNEKFMEESKQLYEKFMTEANLTENELINHELNSEYSIVASTEQLVVVAHTVTETKASSMETVQYVTIDKENNLILTLPLLFKDDTYIQIISDHIKSQMKEMMQKDPNQVFDIDTGDPDDFDHMATEQNFYINAEGKLVIAFGEYEVAPGYMGAQQFVIPTEVIESNIFTHKYLK